MSRKLIALLFAVYLSGCAAQPMHWAKPGATQEAFMQDRYACLQQTPKNASWAYNGPLLISCMAARVYKEDPNGNLTVPPEARVLASGTSSPNIFNAMARGSPVIAARQDYEQAVANYQACVAANPSNPNACESQRNIMNADAQILSAPNVSQQSNVYVGR